jgi:hypothetical protein
MLVAKRLTQHVVVSRLMVGHTHEDIDGCFALIWQLMKALKVSTPQAYSKLVKMACRCKAPEVEVYNIWAVPDYADFFKDVINPHLGRYAKSKLLQSINFNF